MSSDKTSDPFTPTIDALEAKVAEMLATIGMLKRERAVYRGEPLVPASRPDLVVTDRQGAAVAIVEAKRTLEGAELAAAAVKQLESGNCSMTAREISLALMRAGVRLTMRDPAYSVLIALKQRRQAEGDLVLTGYGKWALRKWFAPNEVEELERKWGGTGGRDRDAHAQTTRVAIKKIVSRGGQWGKRRTVTAEHMTKAYEAIQQGKSKLAAATTAGIKAPTFAWYWQVFRMEDWRPGLPFPPPKREIELKKPPKKHEMWPEGRQKANGHVKDNEPQLTLRPAE
jgi:hypothetical protein